MKIPWRSIVRGLIAIFATIFIVGHLDDLVASYITDNDGSSLAHRGSLSFLAVNAAIMFVAFLGGGLIAAYKFMPVALFFAVLMQTSTLLYWSEWLGHSLLSELAAQWHVVAAGVIFSLLGAASGMYARNKFTRRTLAAT